MTDTDEQTRPVQTHIHPAQSARMWPAASETARMLRGLAWAYGLAAFAAGLLSVVPRIEPRAPAGLLVLARSVIPGAALASILIALGGILGCLAMAWARARWDAATAEPDLAEAEAIHPALRRLPDRYRLFRLGVAPRRLPGFVARRPQGIILPLLGLSAAAAAWLLRPATGAAGGGQTLVALGAGAIVLAFPALVAERLMAAQSKARLPEAEDLTALLFVPAVALPAAGCLSIASALGLRGAPVGGFLLAVFLAAVGIEMALRGLAQWFLPPPPAAEARAPINSVAAGLLRPQRFAPQGAAAAIRDNFGIDFSRSWALSFLRAAAAPVALLMLLFCWGLTGVAQIDQDRRGIYERFGAPARVLHPGLHLLLPWPMGKVRPSEFGIVHSVALGTGKPAAAESRGGAEDLAPPSADRLWNEFHATEVSTLIASESGGRQSFQTVSVDLRSVFRVGLTDDDALRAAYRAADPETLVRSETGRLISRFFADRTLDSVLGASREAMAGDLRRDLQAALDRLDTGIEVVVVVIEAIHPPLGAAAAYHNVQAAEIQANALVASERGKALTLAETSRQQVSEFLDQARGAAAEAVGAASVQLRQFTADQAAAHAGGDAFLLERYLGNLVNALPKAPLLIVDHRLGKTDGSVIDLRGAGAPTGAAPNDD